MMEQEAILVVDDDVDIRDSVADVLRDEGFNVMAAANGREALQLLHALPVHPQLILLDMMMPVMDGAAFRAAQLRDAALAHIPVIVFTAHGNARDAASHLGAAGFLKKPLQAEDLLRAVEQHVMRCQAPTSGQP